MIIIQFFHPARNISKDDQPNNISKIHEIPSDVKLILEKACFDCHSNNTRYRWYFNIQPVDWWLTNHIKNGKNGLNFDEFTNKSLRFQYNRLGDVAEEVKKNDMPLDSYTWIHKDAILTDIEKKALINWVQSIRDEMKAKYPADSLERKRRPS
jgi:hypothetical protein